MTGSQPEVDCGNWCELTETMKERVLIDTSCNCTVPTIEPNSQTTSSGTTSNGLKKVFFIILFLIFLLLIRYHWKTMRNFWLKLRNKNHTDHESLLSDNRVTYR